MTIYAIMKNHKYLSRWEAQQSGSPFREDNPKKTYLFRHKSHAEHTAKQLDAKVVEVPEQEVFGNG